jgi:hypothetical protein
MPEDEGLLSPFQNEILRHIQVLVLAGKPVEVDESHLDALVARRAPPLPFAEGIADQVGELPGNPDEGFLARGLEVGD